MGVLPGGTQAIDWGSRQAAANEALVKLYMTLLARREDRLSNNDLRRELAAMGYDKATDLENLRHGNRMAYGDKFYPPAGGVPTGPSPLHRGGAAGSGSPPVAAAPAGVPAVKTIPGSVAPVGTTPSSQTFQKTSQNMDPNMGALLVTMANRARQTNDKPQEGDVTNANDEDVAGALDLADPKAIASTLTGDPTVTAQAQIAPRKGEVRPTGGSRPAGQLPPDQQPRNPRSRVPPKRQAGYAEMDPEIKQHMRDMEEKYKLPRNTLMTIIGFENGGGYDTRKDPNSSAQGWYAFTNELIDEWKRPRSDRNNIYTMTELAAMNLARNRNALTKATGGKVKLGNTVDEIPYYTTLHQWGVGDGPRIVAAMKTNPQVRMIDVMLPQKGRDNGVTLMNNGYDSHTTVGQYASKHYGDRVRPWLTKATEADQQAPTQTAAAPTQVTPQQGDKPGVVKTTEVTAPQQPAAGSGDRRHVLGSFKAATGVKRVLVEAVKGGAQMALPDGYTVHVTSGHRPGGDSRSHHHRRDAIDIQIVGPDGKAIPNRGADTTGMYQLLKRGVKTWAMQNNPQLVPYLGNGSAFGTKIGGGGVPDLMHIDLGGDRGRMDPSQHFSRLKPLSPEEIKQPGTATATADGTYQGGEKPAPATPASPMFVKGGTEATDLIPKNVPKQPALGSSDLLSGTSMTTNFKPTSAPNSKQSEAFAGAPPNVTAPVPLPQPRPQQPITRGQPPTAPPVQADPLAGGTSPEFEGAPVPTIGDQPTPMVEAPAPKKGVFGRLSIAGPQPEKMPPPQGPERDPSFTPGQVFAGNIDVSKQPTALLGKPITVTDENGREVLVPTVDENGKEMTDDEAVQHYARTGKHLGVFDSAENATRKGEQLAEAAVTVPSEAVAEKPKEPTMKGTVEIAAADAKQRQADQAAAAEASKPTSEDKFRQADQQLKDIFGVDKHTKPIIDAILNKVPSVSQIPQLPKLPEGTRAPLKTDAKPEEWPVGGPAAYARDKLIEWAKTPSTATVPTPQEPEVDNPEAPWMQQGPDVLGWLGNLFKSVPKDTGPKPVKAKPFGPPDPTAAPANTPTVDIKPVGAPTTPTTAVPYGAVPAMPGSGGGGGQSKAATPTSPGWKIINGQKIYYQYGEEEPGGTPPTDAAPVEEPVEY